MIFITVFLQLLNLNFFWFCNYSLQFNCSQSTGFSANIHWQILFSTGAWNTELNVIEINLLFISCFSTEYRLFPKDTPSWWLWKAKQPPNSSWASTNLFLLLMVLLKLCINTRSGNWFFLSFPASFHLEQKRIFCFPGFAQAPLPVATTKTETANKATLKWVVTKLTPGILVFPPSLPKTSKSQVTVL